MLISTLIELCYLSLVRKNEWLTLWVFLDLCWFKRCCVSTHGRISWVSQLTHVNCATVFQDLYSRYWIWWAANMRVPQHWLQNRFLYFEEANLEYQPVLQGSHMFQGRPFKWVTPTFWTEMFPQVQDCSFDISLDCFSQDFKIHHLQLRLPLTFTFLTSSFFSFPCHFGRLC